MKLDLQELAFYIVGTLAIIAVLNNRISESMILCLLLITCRLDNRMTKNAIK